MDHRIKIMHVTKRNGTQQPVSFDKVITRLNNMSKKLNLNRVNVIEIAQDTIQGIFDGISTEQLDFLASQNCAERIKDDPQYNRLAAGIIVSNLHKNTTNDFMNVTETLYNNKDINGTNSPIITDEYYNNVKKNIKIINSTIDYQRDYLCDFFSIKTLERAYLIRLKEGSRNVCTLTSNSEKEHFMLSKYGKIVERPQHLWMRVAIGIHGDDIISILETYNLLSNQYMTHASPTLYNAGTVYPQLSSCYLLHMGDNIESIFKTISDAAYISKRAGGIGINIGDIRSKGSAIRGTNGLSDGIVPLARHLNSLSRYINQGGRRNGAIALYIEPWNADVYEYCDLRKQTGVEEDRARDIFLGLWIPDLFFKRVENGEKWSLMCPDECPGLTNVYGEEFEELYCKYEEQGKYKRQVNSEDLWFHILECQIKTGLPYMLYKDHVNRKSNQKNLGTIKCSNLCTEIVEYCDENETAVCNLNSICLPKFIENGKFNFDKLLYVAGVCTKNLDRIIDVNFYPIKEAKYSNLKNRPIGIGVQGFADALCILNIAFDSNEAIYFNKQIFETIYYGAVKASIELAKKNGPYESFYGSPFSEGKLQWHLWGLTENDLVMKWDWNTVIKDMLKYGIRNSQLTTIMPTASTSQIMGNNEACEPYTSNLYTRRTLAGDFTIINAHLVEILIELNLWNKKVKDTFLYDNGSIQHIKEIPDKIKRLYKTAYEMDIKPLLDLAITRGPFIDQSQSMNIFIQEPNFDVLTSSHFYGWENGLKTGMYYCRSKPALDPIKYGLDPDVVKEIEKQRNITHSFPLEYDNNEYNTDNIEHNTDNINDPRRINEIEDNFVDLPDCEWCSG